MAAADIRNKNGGVDEETMASVLSHKLGTLGACPVGVTSLRLLSTRIVESCGFLTVVGLELVLVEAVGSNLANTIVLRCSLADTELKKPLLGNTSVLANMKTADGSAFRYEFRFNKKLPGLPQQEENLRRLMEYLKE